MWIYFSQCLHLDLIYKHSTFIVIVLRAAPCLFSWHFSLFTGSGSALIRVQFSWLQHIGLMPAWAIFCEILHRAAGALITGNLLALRPKSLRKALLCLLSQNKPCARWVLSIFLRRWSRPGILAFLSLSGTSGLFDFNYILWPVRVQVWVPGQGKPSYRSGRVAK